VRPLHCANSTLTDPRTSRQLEWALYTAAFDAQARRKRGLPLQTTPVTFADDWVHSGVPYQYLQDGCDCSQAPLPVEGCQAGECFPSTQPAAEGRRLSVWPSTERDASTRSLEPRRGVSMRIRRGIVRRTRESCSATHGEQAPLQAATWLNCGNNEGWRESSGNYSRMPGTVYSNFSWTRPERV